MNLLRVKLSFDDILEIVSLLDTFLPNKNIRLLEKFQDIYNRVNPTSEIWIEVDNNKK